jgi:hypothetical protein
MTGIALKGTDLDLKIDASIVASATSWSVTPNRDMIEITTLESGRGKIYMPDRHDYTLSMEGLVLRGEGATQIGYLSLLDNLLNKESSIGWTATLDSSTTAFVSGWGYLTSAPIQIAQGSAISFSAEAQGCGDIIINTALA